jgi:hypothetical protein
MDTMDATSSSFEPGREVNHPLLDNAAQQMIAQRRAPAQILRADS